jgi:hypothetical protein
MKESFKHILAIYKRSAWKFAAEIIFHFSSAFEKKSLRCLFVNNINNNNDWGKQQQQQCERCLFALLRTKNFLELIDK